MESIGLAVVEASSVVVGALNLGRGPLKLLLRLHLVLVVHRLKLGWSHPVYWLLIVQYLVLFGALIMIILGRLYHHIHVMIIMVIPLVVVVVLDIAMSSIAIMVVRVLNRVVVILSLRYSLLA